MYGAIIGALTALASGTAKAVKNKKQGQAQANDAAQAGQMRANQLTATPPRSANFGGAAPQSPMAGALNDPMLQAPQMQQEPGAPGRKFY